MPTAKKLSGTTVRLKPADPFELIRWLARSQGDPRKAVAELVQNSLDAGARNIALTRRRVHGTATLLVRDDGEGVIPELDREEALHYLATHVGHSRKLGLTPRERAERVIAGQYGVGLLGFWSIGRRLELRSRVGCSHLFALKLIEDDPRAAIVRLPIRFDLPATFTEIVVSEIHSTAQRTLGGRRLADYLGAELRGQLLTREVKLSIHDGVARGPSRKDFLVVPRRFVGEKLNLPPQFEVPGHGLARIELYLAQGAERPAVQVASAGTLVADDIGTLDILGLTGSPWVGRSLTGIVDFPAFSIPPGSRRGVSPDEAAAAFAAQMEGLAAAVEAELQRLDQERAHASDRDLLRDLKRALRGFQRRLPQYEMPPIAQEGKTEGTDAPTSSGELTGADGAPENFAGESAAELFPPGALHRVYIKPATIEVPSGGERRVRLIAEDAEGRRIRESLAYDWRVSGGGFFLRGEGAWPAVCVEPLTRVGTLGNLSVEVSSDGLRHSATAEIRVTEPREDEAGSALGIPEPRLVSDSGGLWRSRLSGGGWEVNEAHEDYVALRSDPRGRLRYFLALLAKELVHRSYAQPGSEGLLEKMVEILAHAERNLRGV